MNTAALVLAAGQGSRFGGAKQLAQWRGKPLLQHSIDLANSVAPGRVYVVVGAYRDSVIEAVTGAQAVHNPDWQRGLSSSIARGVAALPPDTGRVLLILADQVGLRAESLTGLLRGAEGSKSICCARYQGVNGIPAVFHRCWFPTLMNLDGDRGARELLRSDWAPVNAIDIPEAGIDIDTREDLNRLAGDR